MTRRSLFAACVALLAPKPKPEKIILRVTPFYVPPDMMMVRAPESQYLASVAASIKRSGEILDELEQSLDLKSEVLRLEGRIRR